MRGCRDFSRNCYTQWEADRKVTLLQGDERGEQRSGVKGLIGSVLKASNRFLLANDKAGLGLFHVVISVRREWLELVRQVAEGLFETNGPVLMVQAGPVLIGPQHP